jgi:hypothetical protein
MDRLTKLLIAAIAFAVVQTLNAAAFFQNTIGWSSAARSLMSACPTRGSRSGIVARRGVREGDGKVLRAGQGSIRKEVDMLKLLQSELPKLWTDELYSEKFKASPSTYKDFQHALLHVMKATGKLVEMVEEADHGGQFFVIPDVEKYLADLVICTVRLAITAPNGPFDLEKAVLDRIERKMGVRLAQEG